MITQNEVVSKAVSVINRYGMNMISPPILVQIICSELCATDPEVRLLLDQEYTNPDGKLIRTRGKNGGVSLRSATTVKEVPKLEKTCGGCGKRNDHDAKKCWWCEGKV